MVVCLIQKQSQKEGQNDHFSKISNIHLPKLATSSPMLIRFLHPYATHSPGRATARLGEFVPSTLSNNSPGQATTHLDELACTSWLFSINSHVLAEKDKDIQ